MILVIMVVVFILCHEGRVEDTQNADVCGVQFMHSQVECSHSSVFTTPALLTIVIMTVMPMTLHKICCISESLVLHCTLIWVHASSSCALVVRLLVSAALCVTMNLSFLSTV